MQSGERCKKQNELAEKTGEKEISIPNDVVIQEGEEVVLFGENPTVSFIAEKLGTISYEILTSISQRVKRVFYRE